MRTAQRCCLALLAASLLLLSAVNARNFDIADPRNGIDHAPLKVDKISLDTPREGRRVLAEGQPQAAAPKQEPAAAAQQAAASSSAPTATAQAATVAAAAVSQPAAAVPVATAAVSQPAAATTAQAAAAAATAPSSAGPAATTPASAATASSKPAAVPTQPLTASKPGRKSRAAAAAVAAAGVHGLSAPPRKGGDNLQLPEEKVEQMTLEQLLAEDAPPTACRWEPKTAGIKWNVGCANKALGASCDGMVLAQPPFCDGKGGSIATTKCLPDGEWGQVEVLC